MKNHAPKIKVIWAVDPFASEKAIQKAAAVAIQELTKHRAAEIEPIYVAGSGLLDLSEGFHAELLRQLNESAGIALGRLVKKLALPALKPIRILPQLGNSLQQSAQSLLDYAHGAHADIIVMSTRARKGPKRWLMGSFAESMTLISDIPLLIVPPTARKPTDYRHILYPTDFSAASRAAFHKVVQLARAQKSKITVYHKVSYEWMYWSDPMFMVTPDIQRLLKDESNWKKKEAQSWVKAAKKLGVEVAVSFDESRTYSAAEGILKRARRKHGIVAMVGVSGQFEAAVMGSTSRQVIREASTPVWIVHAPEAIGREMEAGMSIDIAESRSVSH